LIKTKKPEQTEQALMDLYPEKYWTSINNSFITFGKLICKPISPNCNECPLEKICPKLIIPPKASKRKKKKK
jgi:endonuclease III